MKQPLHFSRFVAIVLLVFAVPFLVSCGDNRSAKRTARAFLQSYYVDNDFDGAKLVSTEATFQTLDFQAMLFVLNPHSASESIQDFRIRRMDTRKTKATCFYEVIGQERRLNLRKVQGKWLVDMPEGLVREPGFSLSQTSGQGGFASAQSEPIRLRDVPPAVPRDTLLAPIDSQQTLDPIKP
jgi:hypothetical protein